MRTFLWRLLNLNRPTVLGRCVHCGSELQTCGSCRGSWRETPCDCGIGLRCPQHSRFWS